MSGIATGGSAFPEVTTDCDPTGHRVGEHYANTYSYGGMTLRDYFAGQALLGGMAFGHDIPDDLDQIAAYSYRVADAMLKEREQER